ncbi:DUF155-domain-containing protein [Panus rudis PR-1116 ss-1]|nr:DUF155-domain-containing protein [Panus rudis PR-1116 ss-1]
MADITRPKPPRPTPSRPTVPPLSRSRARTLTTAAPRKLARRASISGLTLPNSITTTIPGSGVITANKAQRTSKTTQKLVVLPTAPQTKPLLEEDEDAVVLHGYETDTGVRELKNEGERMTKEQRKKAGFKRITAYCVAESFKMKVMASFLKREHNVQPRMFDEALYVMYHLPLLPGYGPGANIRSSAPPADETPAVPPTSEVEESGYVTSPPASPPASAPAVDSYVSLVEAVPPTPAAATDTETDVQSYHSLPTPDVDGTFTTHHDERDGSVTPLATAASLPAVESSHSVPHSHHSHHSHSHKELDSFAEVVFFSYGVVVFFGLAESQERAILEDIQEAGVMRRPLGEDQWEIEECHYAYDSHIVYPRVYNDFFTFKSHSTLSTLSVAHALAQSTLLARYETLTHTTLSSPSSLAIPQQLASTGSLHLSRTEALKLTGRLFKLRRDVNLVSNVLDVPELFWEETQTQGRLRALYDAVREYMEIGPRVEVLNDKLAVAESLLDAIHDHLNNNAMERITWIIIWLIVVACLVEVGEVIARLIFHATKAESSTAACNILTTTSNLEEVLSVLERMMGS